MFCMKIVIRYTYKLLFIAEGTTDTPWTRVYTRNTREDAEKL